MHIRNRGIILIASSLAVFFVISEIASHSMEYKRKAIAEARSSYLRALAQTRVQLAAHLTELSYDPILVSDMSSKLSYSTSRSLENEIHPGTFDFYALYDDSCKVLSKTGSSSFQASLCKKNLSGQWRWLSYENKTIMFLLRARNDIEKPFLLGAGRYLNENWAKSFPNLLSKLQDADLKIDAFPVKIECRWPHLCTKFNKSVWIEGVDASGLALASLVSTDPFFPFLRPWLLSLEPLSNPLSIPLLFALFLIFLWQLFQSRFSKTQAEEDKAAFLRWTEHPLSGKVPTPEFPWLEKAQETLSGLLSQCAHRSNELSALCEKQKGEIYRLEALLHETECKLSEQIPYEVLSTHIASSAPNVQKMLSNFIEGSADLGSIMEKGIAPLNRKIIEMLKVWQNGIAVRGERYYMKSLYEQESKIEGQSLLKSEILKLFTLSEQIQTTLVQTLTLLKTFEKQESDAAQIFASWSLLAEKIKNPNMHVNKIGEAAASLLQIQSEQRISFMSKLSSNFQLDIPVPVLLGALYTMFATIKEGLLEDETLVFQVHKRMKSDHFVLALSVTNERGKILLCHPKEEGVERVVRILKPWGMQCQGIHRPEGGTYLVLKGSPSLIVQHSQTEQLREEENLVL